MIVNVVEYDAETGLYYLNSRYYDPEIGRWINAIGTILILAPILVLLYLQSKDDDIAMNYRILSKIGFGFLIFCYVAGGIGKAIALALCTWFLT